MKKLNIIAMGLLIGAGIVSMASCKGKTAAADSDTTTDTTEVAEVAEVPVAERDSLAKIFDNPDKKSETATDSTYAVTASGLKYLVLKEGTGAHPTATDQVTVNYEGRLTTGYVFDSSYQRGEPTSFPLDHVIAGWTEGLQLMTPGSTYIFYIPGKLAYGEMGAPQANIGPNEDLIFKVDLLDIVK